MDAEHAPGVCPNDALKMEVVEGLWVPKVLLDNCTSCGICGRVCPGYEVDFESLNVKAFGKQPSDRLTGECSKLSCRVIQWIKILGIILHLVD